MSRHSSPSLLTKAALTSVAVVAAAGMLSAVSPTPAATAAERQASADASGSRIAASPLRWHRCGDPFQCARVQVPLDYDRPHAARIGLSLVRIPAGDPAHRIGSVFVNPGGPGNSGVDFVRTDARNVLPGAVQNRFDVIGFDPRGVGRSTPVRCFASTAQQQEFFGAQPAFPVGRRQTQRFMASMADLGRRCAQRNEKLVGHLSTANVARDLDLLRRAVGDSKLTYAGYSYGSLLGETYANLFPHRVGALALDGILDPVAWTTGRGDSGRRVPFSLRVGGPRATSQALGFFLRQCQQAGPDGCAFAGRHTAAKFDTLMRRLRSAPVILDAGQGPQPFTYDDIVDGLRGGLTFPPIWPDIAGLLQASFQASEPTSAQHKGAGVPEVAIPTAAAAAASYDNSREALLAVACSETTNPRTASAWPAAARRADAKAPYFGADWTFVSAACATWPAHDADRYTGPFNRRPAHGALLISSRFDAANPYGRAVAVARSMPGSRLLTVKGAGHPASFTDNTCVDTAVARYLIHGKLPARGAVCQPAGHPFG